MFTAPDYSLGVAWIDCLRHVLEHGARISDGPQRLLEVLGYHCTVTSVDADEPLIRQFADSERIRLMHRKYASTEVLPQYTISYGALLYDHHGVDQVEWAVHRLLGKRESKSATIGLHTPGADDVSCLSLLDFKVREDTLHMTAVYRSQNVYASQPGNLLALREVQEHVAAEVGAAVGDLSLHALSAHVYEADESAAAGIVQAYDRQVQYRMRQSGTRAASSRVNQVRSAAIVSLG